jgi:histone acetyltransferase
MDLEKMTKRLKAGKYLSKAEFHRDVELIVSNCRWFNDPGSIYVRKVTALNNKAATFLKQVMSDNVRERQHALQVCANNDTNRHGR